MCLHRGRFYDFFFFSRRGPHCALGHRWLVAAELRKDRIVPSIRRRPEPRPVATHQFPEGYRPQKVAYSPYPASLHPSAVHPGLSRATRSRWPLYETNAYDNAGRKGLSPAGSMTRRTKGRKSHGFNLSMSRAHQRPPVRSKLKSGRASRSGAHQRVARLGAGRQSARLHPPMSTDA